MRKELKQLKNIRDRFTGTFERYGKKSGYMGEKPTILLKDIKQYESEEIITDHLWFNLTKGFEAADLKEGDIISFDARVTKYKKGYHGRREDVYKPTEFDYRLSRPTKIQKEN